jgi:hypothetical protein
MLEPERSVRQRKGGNGMAVVHHNDPDWRSRLAGACWRCARLGAAAARRIGRRGAFLGFLALLDLVVGFSLTQPLPFGLTAKVLYQPFVMIMPLRLWALWWISTGLVALVACVWTRIRPAMFGLGALLKTAWGLGYLVGWAADMPAFGRGYYGTAVWISFAFVTLTVAGWRENGE